MWLPFATALYSEELTLNAELRIKMFVTPIIKMNVGKLTFRFAGTNLKIYAEMSPIRSVTTNRFQFAKQSRDGFVNLKMFVVLKPHMFATAGVAEMFLVGCASQFKIAIR